MTTTTTSATPVPRPASDLELEIALLHQPAIDSARRMIVWAGALYPIQAVLIFAMLARFVGAAVFATEAFAWVFGIACAIFGVHLALAWWARKDPLPPTTIALAACIGYIVMILQDSAPGSIVVPIVGAFILGRAVLASYRVRKLRAQAARA